MARLDTFTFRVDEEEKRLIAALSVRLERNQSDAMRLLLRESARALGVKQPAPKPVTDKGVRHVASHN
jgi:hypothetical protein